MKIHIILYLLLWSTSSLKCYAQEYLEPRHMYSKLSEMLQKPDSVMFIIIHNRNTDEIDSILDNLTHFKNLKAIQITSSELISFPKNILNAKNLEYLSISFCKLSNNLSLICKLKNLKYLDLSNNNIEELPKNIGLLKKLEKLCLDRNNLTTLPKSIQKLRSLQGLFLNYTGLKNVALPNNLIHLEMNGCKLTEISFITENQTLTKTLRHIILQQNQIDYIPAKLDSFTNLTLIILDENKIEQIDCTFKNLKKLEYITARHNLLNPEIIQNFKTNLNFVKTVLF